MKKYITDERTGLKYELVGDYYLIAREDEPEQKPIGIWGQRHCNYLREHKHCIYSALLISGKLESYLWEIDRHSETMFSQLVKQIAAQEGINEELKAENQLLWAQRMNAVWNSALEIVDHDLIYS